MSLQIQDDGLTWMIRENEGMCTSQPGGWLKTWYKFMQSIHRRTITYRAGVWEKVDTNIISEKAVALTVNNEYWLTFMCTPVDLEALATGFLYNEDIIQSMEDVANVRVCPGEDNVDIWLNHSVKKPEKWIRTAGCLGGETSIDESHYSALKTIPQNGLVLLPEAIKTIIRIFIDRQGLYRISGGVHTSAWSDGEKILMTAEDIGRHNTLDKLAGRTMLEHFQPTRRIILTTGRVSSEMIQKSVRMSASMVISRTSPTSLSVQMAEESGITLVGYARGDRFIIYTHPERVLTTLLGEKISPEEI